VCIRGHSDSTASNYEFPGSPWLGREQTSDAGAGPPTTGEGVEGQSCAGLARRRYEHGRLRTGVL